MKKIRVDELVLGDVVTDGIPGHEFTYTVREINTNACGSTKIHINEDWCYSAYYMVTVDRPDTTEVVI